MAPISNFSTFVRTPLALAVALLATHALAQSVTQTVTVTGRTTNLPAASVSGFGDEPLARTPLSASVYSQASLLDNGTRSIAELTRLDARLSDAYNAEGYWSQLTVRGFVLDNRVNYRRDGLPINAETVLPLDNKSALEVLAGTSGIQAGTSAPGGLVNLVVKRPDGRVRSARVEARQGGSTSVAIDLGQRFGGDDAFGLRVNAAYEHLDPPVRSARGQRRMLAAAADWRITKDTLVDAEFETSRQQQPSVPGFSMLGNSVPDARRIDPRINLNNQPWTEPVLLAADTASLRFTQRLAADWRMSLHGMTQRLRSDDRVAFPFGVFDANDYSCAQWCDRFAPDGSFTLWQFKSDNERRRSDALDLSLAGKATLAGIEHRVQAGVLATRFKARFEGQLFDIAGTGLIDGSAVTPPSPGFVDTNTDRSERSTELYLRDALQLSAQASLWAGLRHTRLSRNSVRTDGSAATSYDQSATLPWLALAYQATPATMFYASWGQGLESDVVPNRARYANRGQALPALTSRQIEAGVKHTSAAFDATLTAFSIERPQAADFGPCDVDDSCVRRIDGSAVHRGIEAQLATQRGAWHLQASALALHARREGSANAGVNGLRPTNVPATSLRLQAGYAITPAARLQIALAHESNRIVLPDNSARVPGWTRLDAALRVEQQAGPLRLVWRAGIDNLADKRAWKESPYQFSHVYLFPMAPRTLRLSLQADL